MVTLLGLLPRSLTTFLFALAALFRFYGNSDTIPLQLFPFTYLQWSFATFMAATLALVVNLGLEWNTGHRSRYREIEARERERQRDRRADEERQRADRERNLASEERQRADRERNLADAERRQAERERRRANEDRRRAVEERGRAAYRAYLQSQFAVVQLRYTLEPSPQTRGALINLLALLEEYGGV
ncbi:hypothetical protein [Synechococcus sp. PCC 6312]|uniref:hypothetical protein n=1 Tax=Synechococcus sp. (strain ATCC 27167 / PCC 6312) TaxID=195253 RepID=UPI00029F1A29|nr:hypothetical protein [Synechococcus sp. PCC 6312]AFY61389.1 hypothetical protein Syn6312_2274 [Synechococcus sp. PCC 6312]